MTERPSFPPPPIKTRVQQADGTHTLQWATWFGVVANWAQRVRVFSFAVDIPSIPAGSGWWVQVTCPGVVPGDFALASFNPIDRDLAVSAQVTAADVVTVWVRNWSGGAIDPAAGTMRVRTEKAR